MYANPNQILNSKVKGLMDMGFSEEDAKRGLTKNNLDLEKALDYLINQND